MLKITLKNTLKGLFVIIPVFVLGNPAFSFTKLFPSPSASLVSKPPLGFLEKKKVYFTSPREPIQTLVDLKNDSEADASLKVNLMINNEPLLDVLQRIAEETNISFRVPSDLFSKRISANIHVSNWGEGVNELLKDMNRLSVWDKNSNLTQVIILGRKSSTNAPGRETSSISASKANFQHRAPTALTVASAQLREKPSESNLRKLLHLQPGTPLPEELFNTPDVNQFLKANGIQSPNDWKEFHKARVVHKSIRRELRQILVKN